MTKQSIGHEQSAKYQYFAALVVNIFLMCYGVTCGWASPSIILLMSDETPLPSGKITMDEASYVASLICIGGLIGNIVFGFITNKFGRKIPLLFLTLPAIISWTLIWFAQNVYYLYAARLLNGFFGGGIYTIVPLFLSEIAVDRVRGVLGSTLVLSGNIGILIAFTLGNYFDFTITPKFVIASAALCFVLLFSFPETPLFLMKQNKISEAEKSIRFYQNLKGDTDYEVLQTEMNKLRSSLEGNSPNKTTNNSLKCSDLMTGSGKKAMIIGIVLAALNQLCGCFAMLQYTANIFKEAGSNMSPNMSAIVVGVIQLLGSYVASALVDRAGRKFLFAVSTIGIACGSITLGVYMMLKTSGYDVESVNWIPIVSFSFVIFIASWAVLTLPFLVISEILPEKLKNFGTSFCMAILWSSSYAMIKYLPLLTDTFGFHGTLFIFSAVCLASAIFIIFYMPETKGKSYEEIMNLLQ
ncbi:facilitated trehalose transporter Tret1-like [Sitodiplosis mosellana]|uniref:facilitated trehalose transporter Tret1-like n=1 Tax=Sitodiplosis mosellana TaxID=263140 RepID=UPI002443FBF9|nr:facilitated trehalose transporter Tret1-like [Sitodiplosis mosellana]